MTLINLRLMLQTALSRACDSAAHGLCTLPAAQELSVTDCASMLQLALSHGLKLSVSTMCSLPAASDITVDVWIELFRSAVVSRQAPGLDRSLQSFCKLPAARQASPADIAELLTRAVSLQNYTATESLCSLPAVGGISRAQLLVLVHDLIGRSGGRQSAHWRQVEVACNNARCFHDTLAGLGKLQVLRLMSSAELLELLDAMKQHRKFEPIISWLHNIPAANDIPADVMTQYLERAVQQQDSVWMVALCLLPAVGHIDVDVLLQLIRKAVAVRNMHDSDIIQQLCDIMVAHQLNNYQLKTVTLLLITSSQSDWYTRVVQTICEQQAPAAATLTPDDVADLLFGTISHRYMGQGIDILCLLKADAITSSSSKLLDAITSAAWQYYHTASDMTWDQVCFKFLKVLCELPAARQCPYETLTALVQKAKRQAACAQAVQHAGSTTCR